MKKSVWILGPMATGLMLALGAGSTFAGFTYEATVSGTAEAISLPTVLPLTVNAIESPDPGQPKSGVGQPVTFGEIRNAGSEAYAPAVSLSGVPGVQLESEPGSLQPGTSASLVLTDLAKAPPGKYTLTVTVALGGFSESNSVPVTIKDPKKDKDSKSDKSTDSTSNASQSNSAGGKTSPSPSSESSGPSGTQ